MKKIIVYAACFLIVSSAAVAAPGSKLIERFNATFPNAKNVKWSDDKAGYFVSFTQDDNFNKVFYNTNGEFVYSLKYTNGVDLPVNIKMILNKRFEEYNMIGVTAVTTQSNVVYDIKLTKGEKLYCLNISADGAITKEEQFDHNSN